MSYWEDNTVEVEYNGKKTRVAKEDAYIFENIGQKKDKKSKKEE